MLFGVKSILLKNGYFLDCVVQDLAGNFHANEGVNVFLGVSGHDLIFVILVIAHSPANKYQMFKYFVSLYIYIYRYIYIYIYI